MLTCSFHFKENNINVKRKNNYRKIVQIYYSLYLYNPQKEVCQPKTTLELNIQTFMGT